MGVFIVNCTNISAGHPRKQTAMIQAAATLWGKIATLFLFATWMPVLIFYMLKSGIYDTTSIYE